MRTLLLVLTLTTLAWAGESILQRLGPAYLKIFWAAHGPEYPTRCEVWLQNRKVQEFTVKPGRRQRVQLVDWSEGRLLATRREWPFERMSDDYVTSMRSCLWLYTPGKPPVAWKRGAWTKAGIMDVRHGVVCVGIDGDVGGGAGYPPWTAWKTLVFTDVEGHEQGRLTNLEADDNTNGEHCLSPNARWVATYTVAPSFDYAELIVRSVNGSKSRSFPNAGLFHWLDDGKIKVGPKVYDPVTF